MSVRKISTASILSPAYKNSKIWDGTTFPGYFESIATVIVPSAGAANVEFTNIPNSYTHLQIRIFGRSARVNTVDALNLRFNSDTDFYYADHWLYGDGSSASATGGGGVAQIQLVRIAGDSASSSVFGSIIVDILDYTNTNKFKTIRSLGGADNNGSGQVNFVSGLWRKTDAITSIILTPSTSTNWKQYSHVALYGIRSA